jgi:hypothetical protein
MTLLRGLYQACWLLRQKPQSSGDSTTSLHLGAAGNGNSRRDMKDQQEQLRRSVEVLQQDFNVFVQGMQEQGWEVSKLVLKIPDNAPILSEIIC